MHSLTDRGNALRFVDAYAHQLRFNAARGWMTYNGRYWQCDEIYAQHLACLCAEEIAREAQDERLTEEGQKRILEWSRKSLSYNSIRSMLQLARSDQRIAGDMGRFDQKPWLLNVENGTLDLETGALHDFNSADLLTQMANVTYDPDAECPRWDQFLQEITNDNKDLQLTLQQIAGYCLTGSTQARCLFVLYGTGANGKSIFLDTLAHLLGSYAMVAAPGTFSGKFGESPSTTATPQIAELAGRRLVLASETEQGSMLKEATLKNVTGDSLLTARHLYGKLFQFMPTFKVLMATNHKPQIRGGGDALWDRLKLLPFSVTVPMEKRDPELLFTLRTESSGILNWAMMGLGIWIFQGKRFKFDQETVDATVEYREDTDLILQFLSECVVEDPTAHIPNGDFYLLYKKWTESKGNPVATHRGFTLMMKERGLKIDRTNKMRYWVGVRLTPDAMAMIQTNRPTFWN